MLQFAVSEMVELLLICILQQTQRIEETKRRLNAELLRVVHLQGRGSCYATRGSKGADAYEAGKEGKGAEHLSTVDSGLWKVYTVKVHGAAL